MQTKSPYRYTGIFSINKVPNPTGGSTRPGVWVAIEVKLLIGALGGPQGYLGAPKDPPRGLKWQKITLKEKKSKN